MMLTLKVSYQGDVRRITIEKEPNFVELQKLLQGMYSLPDFSNVVLKYLDEDNELVRVTCDIELKEALLAVTTTRNNSKLLRLFLSDPNDTQNDISPLLQSIANLPQLEQSINQLQQILNNPYLSRFINPQPMPPSPSHMPPLPYLPRMHPMGSPMGSPIPASTGPGPAPAPAPPKDAGVVIPDVPEFNWTRPTSTPSNDIKPVEKSAEKSVESALDKLTEKVADVRLENPVEQKPIQEKPAAVNPFEKPAPATDNIKLEPTGTELKIDADKSAPSGMEKKYDAKFIRDGSVSDLTEMSPFQPFVKGWILKNEGTEEWPKGTRLQWVAGDKLSTDLSVEVEPLSSGEEREIKMPMIAPARPGRYVGYYRMVLPSGERFGHRVWVDIYVKSWAMGNNGNAAAPQPASNEPVPSPQPAVPQPTSERSIPANYKLAIDQLKHMGFTDIDRIIRVLDSTKGNLPEALDALLAGR